MNKIFNTLTIVFIIVVFIILLLSVKDSINKKENCFNKCKHYRSMIIEETCYCNSDLNKWEQPR